MDTKNDNPSEEVLLEGELSVRAAITGGMRTVKEVLLEREKLNKRDRKLIALAAECKKRDIPVTVLTRERIDERIAEASPFAGHTHGGVAAIAGIRRFTPLSKLLDQPSARYFVCLDGIEDPYNLGYAMRTFYAMGAGGILLPNRDYTTLDSAVLRASAGASEHIGIALMEKDDTMTADIIASRGFDILCSAKNKDSVSLFAFKPDKPSVLFIGGEKRGISPVFMERAAHIIHIPYPNAAVRYSLPAVCVCAMYAAAFAEAPTEGN